MSTGPLIATLKVREVKKVSQGCPFNRGAQLFSGQVSNSSYSSSVSDENEVVQSGPGNTVTYSIHLAMDTAHYSLDGCSTHLYRRPRGREDSEVSHIHDGSSPLSVFLLYFAEIIMLLVVETNPCYHDHVEDNKGRAVRQGLISPYLTALQHTAFHLIMGFFFNF
jgi:hypothetical protein